MEFKLKIIWRLRQSMLLPGVKKVTDNLMAQHNSGDMYYFLC